jgi:hypothetical protein
MKAAELRARLTAIAAEPLPGEVAHGDDVLEILDRSPVPAAVLVPVILGPTPGILLTKRNAHLNKHGGGHFPADASMRTMRCRSGRSRAS